MCRTMCVDSAGWGGGAACTATARATVDGLLVVISGALRRCRRRSMVVVVGMVVLLLRWVRTSVRRMIRQSRNRQKVLLRRTIVPTGRSR